MSRKRPPRVVFARRNANPTLATLEYVRSALRRAKVPLSRNDILGILADWGHSTTRQSLNAALGFLGEDGLVAEGSKGLIWVPEGVSRSLDEAVRAGRRL